MGLFDFLGGGTPAEKAQRLKSKITQKYGDAQNRQKAIQDCIKLESPDTLPVLLQRFLFTVDPQTTDRMEKDEVFTAVCAHEEKAVPHVVDFLKQNDHASSWALKILDEILEDEQVVAIATGELARLGAEYTRDPQKKEVLLHFLSEKTDARIGPLTLQFFLDMSDDVKMAAVRTAVATKEATAKDALLQLLATDDVAKRVQTACVDALHTLGFDVGAMKDTVAKKIEDPYFLDKQGFVKKKEPRTA